jgi:hypothetical protein
VSRIRESIATKAKRQIFAYHSKIYARKDATNSLSWFISGEGKTIIAELIGYYDSRRNNGARNIQRLWRGSIGRVIAKKVRDEMLLRKLVVEEKPKRTPLHLIAHIARVMTP